MTWLVILMHDSCRERTGNGADPGPKRGGVQPIPCRTREHNMRKASYRGKRIVMTLTKGYPRTLRSRACCALGRPTAGHLLACKAPSHTSANTTVSVHCQIFRAKIVIATCFRVWRVFGGFQARCSLLFSLPLENASKSTAILCTQESYTHTDHWCLDSIHPAHFALPLALVRVCVALSSWLNPNSCLACM